MDSAYDVVVVGGGAAGLAAALTLGRARRSVLVLEDGTPRNAPAGHVHNYLGRESVPPAELAETGRAEVASYGGHVVTAAVAAAQPRDGGGFRVRLVDGRTVDARRLVVATGLADELPPLPGVAERWGRDVLHCPYCHGWEVRDSRIAVLATGPLSVHQALLFRQWSADVLLLQHTAAAPDDTEREQLAARGVVVVTGEVDHLDVTEDRLTGATLRSGERVPFDALVVAPFMRARADVLLGLGLTPVPLRMGDIAVATYVESDATGATSVPGVWVAGNVTDPRAQVITSAAAGVTVAAAVNADLVTDDTARGVAARAAHRTGHHGHAEPGPDQPRDEAFWDGHYRSRQPQAVARPNTALVAEATALTPGRALDVGCGEGGDAIWLAQQGWQVTALDLSTEALARAEAHAASAGVAERITWEQADLTSALLPVASYDLVSACFVHLPPGHLDELHRKLAAAVVPGGTLLVVGHHPSDVDAGVGRWSAPEQVWASDQVAGGLDDAEWEVTTAQDRPRQESDLQGRPTTVHDAVLTARRRSP